MITISPLQKEQVGEARRVIAGVAGRLFEPHMTLDEFAAEMDAGHELDDVDDFQQVYGGERGLFLAVLDNDRLVGTGALRPLETDTAELKRIWLLEEYQGRGIGYRLVTRLLRFAREAGYTRVVLQTSHESVRALALYRRLGFVDIPPYYETPWEDEIFLGMLLDE